VGGYANMWVHTRGITKQVIFSSDKNSIVKARFIDKNKILLGILSNEAVLFDIKNKKEIFRVQLSESKFSDFALNADKSRAVFACESGVLNIIDTRDGKIIKQLEGANVDNVYKVGFNNGIISTAGQDRRAGIYDEKRAKSDYIKASFLVYATALSPSGKVVAFSMDEQNSITIFDTKSKTKIVKLRGHRSTLSSIIFMSEKIIFSSSDDNRIMVWKIK
jgi:WD40 repeat protein